MGQRPTVLVTDASMRIALEVIRSLGKAGYFVVAVEHDGIPFRHVLGFSSRYTSCFETVHSPHHFPEAFLDDLESAAENVDMILPVHFQTLRLLAENRSRFNGKVPLMPPVPVLDTANNTHELLPIAEQCGLNVPATWEPAHEDDCERLAESVSYPAVVKLPREGNVLSVDRYGIASTPSELVNIYRRLNIYGDRPIIQQYIDGEGVGAFFLYDGNGDRRAWFSHQRLREFPVSGGPSTYCRALDDDRGIQYGTKLLDELGWQGVAMVEFKREYRTGTYYLMEINPRLWGSLPLASRAGVNFSDLWVKLSLGESVSFSPGTVDHSARLQFRVTDIIGGISELRQGRGLPLLRRLRDACNPYISEGVLSFVDYKPTLPYLRRYFSLWKNSQ